MSFTRKALLISMSQIVTIALGVLSSIVLYRAMGPDGTGQFNLFRKVSMFAAAFSAFGFGSASVFYLRNKKTPIEQVVGTLTTYAAIVSLPLFVVILVGVRIMPDYFGRVSFLVVIGFAVGVACLVCQVILRKVLLAQMAAKRIALTSLTPTAVLLVGGSILWSLHRMTASAAILLFALSQLLTMLQVIQYLWRHMHWGTFRWNLFKGLFTYGSKLYIANLLLQLGSAGVMMLLRQLTLTDFSQIGLFSCAVGVSSYIMVPIRSITGLLYAKWSEVSGQTRILQVERVARVNMAYGLMASIGAILLGRFAIWIMYGSEFIPAQGALNLMAFGSALMSFYAIFDNLLAGSGHAGVSVWIFGFTGLLSILLTRLLVPSMGFFGAAAATLIANAVTSTTGLIVCWRLIGIRPLHCLLVRPDDVRYLLATLRMRKSLRPVAVPAEAPLVAEESNEPPL